MESCITMNLIFLWLSTSGNPKTIKKHMTIHLGMTNRVSNFTLSQFLILRLSRMI